MWKPMAIALSTILSLSTLGTLLFVNMQHPQTNIGRELKASGTPPDSPLDPNKIPKHLLKYEQPPDPRRSNELTLLNRPHEKYDVKGLQALGQLLDEISDAEFKRYWELYKEIKKSGNLKPYQVLAGLLLLQSTSRRNLDI